VRPSKDAKKLIAYSSIAHMNVVVMGLFIFDAKALFGAIYLSVGHAIISTAMFYLIGILYDRLHTRELELMGGLVHLMPLYSSALFFFCFANAGFPWSLSFIGETMLLIGIIKLSLLTYFVLVAAFVTLLYTNIRLFSTICFGSADNKVISNAISDLTHLELFSCFILAINAIILMVGCDPYFSIMYLDDLVRYIEYRPLST